MSGHVLHVTQLILLEGHNMSQPLNWWIDYYASMLWQGNYQTKEEIKEVLEFLMNEAVKSAGRA
jgi:hypothetical protein